ncbi:hypothetical protein QBC43DRAFT_337776 [Cladorrhinum sp. PSN259]|nr:hypothetical protein QBC43DRAFT_337776 [Cladorrhinum sp. PSN259]
MSTTVTAMPTPSPSAASLPLEKAIVVVLPSVTILTTILLALRFYCKRRYNKVIGWDDYLLVASYISYLASLVCLLIASLGRHPNHSEEDNFDQGVHVMSAGSAFNILSLVLTKVAIIVTLLRITESTQNVWHRFFLYSAAILTVITVGSAGMYICLETWYNTLDEDCIDGAPMWKYGIFVGVWSTISDFLIAAFSWIIIWKLQMHISDKIGVGLVLSLGMLAGAIAGIKVHQLVDFCAAIDPNVPYDTGLLAKRSIILVLWSFVEAAVMVMGATAPNVRLLIQGISKRLMQLGWIKTDSREASTKNGLSVTLGRTAGASDLYERHVRAPWANQHGPDSAATLELPIRLPPLPDIERTRGEFGVYSIDVEVEIVKDDKP